MELSNYKSKWDSISISASLLCAIHCVVLPLFFTTLPLFNFDIIENIWIESFTILVSAFLVAGPFSMGIENIIKISSWSLFFGKAC